MYLKSFTIKNRYFLVILFIHLIIFFITTISFNFIINDSKKKLYIYCYFFYLIRHGNK